MHRNWPSAKSENSPTRKRRRFPGRYFVPTADIFETDEALTVIMEMPGVEKNNVSIALENDVLQVDGQIDFSKYEGMEPVYTVQCRTLRTRVHALGEDRSRQNQCAA